jgi:hypothetical protein
MFETECKRKVYPLLMQAVQIYKELKEMDNVGNCFYLAKDFTKAINYLKNI